MSKVCLVDQILMTYGTNKSTTTQSNVEKSAIEF